MLQHSSNQWFSHVEFMRAARAVYEARGTLNYLRESNLLGAKYIQLYVDQRTGDFIFRFPEGGIMSTKEVYQLFPELRDDTVIVSAGVRPYPE